MKSSLFIFPCMFVASLPSCSRRSSTGISLSVPRVKNNIGSGAFQSCALSLWNNLPLSVHSAILKTHLFDWASPLWHRHTWQPIDAMELFHQFCYWTLIQLSHHWAWHCQGYWTLIDWLIKYRFSTGDLAVVKDAIVQDAQASRILITNNLSQRGLGDHVKF